MTKLTSFPFLLLLLCCWTSCQNKSADSLFVALDSSQTGIDFVNRLENFEDYNIFNYRNYYNGGGVAIGDLNNDGLQDIYFTSNLGANKLYLNKGNFQFEDISEKAGVSEMDKWSTGVVMVDINHDGWLDIYVCNAGYRAKDNQKNSLYINQGNLQFKEVAAQMGLDDAGYTTHAAFFDYDLDGDLDVYLLNNSFIPVNTLNYSNKRSLRAKDWPVKDFLKGGGDKLLRNDNGQFTNVSETAGIYGSLIGFGLGVSVGHLNDDQYPDLYISNDFFERDYLYLNNGDGTFSEELEKRVGHISHSSMGSDVADINNDGYMDLFVTDMLPSDEYRLKTMAGFDDINIHQLKVKQGFHYQFMHNTLQLNNGNGQFKDISYFADVAASDWSWGALMFDMDNDRNTDLFVCNGILHDVIDRDFMDFFANELMQEMTASGNKKELDSLISLMPSVSLKNKVFRNTGQLAFQSVGDEWGFDQKTFSNGAAYADLDNDGDYDLVVNNINQKALVYQNQSTNNYCKIRLKGSTQNPKAIGAKVRLTYSGGSLTKEVMPSRGFQSSVDYDLIFGLDSIAQVDAVSVRWPDGNEQMFDDIQINTVNEIIYNQGNTSPVSQATADPLLVKASFPEFVKHQENAFVDFYYERNIPFALSQEGPDADVGDVNGDGLDDLYISGAADQAGTLYLGKAEGGFSIKETPVFQNNNFYEEVAVRFIDVDQDKDLDLMVGHGGNHLQKNVRNYQDVLYLNDGTGVYKTSPLGLPNNNMNTAVVAPFDYNDDGKLDVFIGSRNRPGNYGLNPTSYLLENFGNGNFQNSIEKHAPLLRRLGMITDARWVNLLGGPHKELIVAGEWMFPVIFQYNGKTLEPVNSNLVDYNGLWQSIAPTDANGDGKIDLVLGNIGQNFYLDESQQPVKLWISDFDNNEVLDKVISRNVKGKDVPVFLKKELTDQLSVLKKNALLHKDYANKQMSDLFDAKQREKALIKEVNYFSSVLALNQGDGNFVLKHLPAAVQLSSVNSILPIDLDNDGDEDLVLGGNKYDLLPQFSRLDASRGEVLINDGKGNYRSLSNSLSGLDIEGEIQKILKFKNNKQTYLLFLINNEK
ncbi:MAG: VCBS repeat-containing protein, partial [Bacteroidota bacterium]